MDSLSICSNSKTDTIKIAALNELSRLYSGSDNLKALTSSFKALKISQKINSKKYIAYSYNRIGTVYDIDGKPDSANFYFIEALKIFESIRDFSGLGTVYQNIGVMNYYLDDFEKALLNYNKALELKIKINEHKSIGQLYNNIGVILRRQNKFNEAIHIYRKSLIHKSKISDPGSFGGTYQNMGKAFLELGKIDSVQFYYLKAKSNFEETGNYKDLATLYTSFSELNVYKKENKKATENIEKAIEYAKKANANDALVHIYEMAYLIDTLNNNFKNASEHIRKSIEYRQKVFKSEKAKSIEKLQAIYESQKKDEEIIHLNNEAERQHLKRNLLLIVIMLITIMLFSFIYFYYKKRKANILLQKQKKEIEHKTNQIALQSAQIARLQSQMNPHFIFNALNSIQQFVLQNNTNKTLSYINDFSKLMRITLNNSDKETITLKEELDFLNLYLHFELLRYQNKFEIKIITDENIDIESVKTIPMLVQPFAENAIKHGFSSLKKMGLLEILFNLKNKNKLQITIRDNGVGRKVSAENKSVNPLHESKGLKITEDRIRAFNNKHNFNCENPYLITDLEQGTEIKITLPLIEDF